MRHRIVITLGLAILPFVFVSGAALAFHDVGPAHPSVGAVTVLSDRGIIPGFGDGRFHPAGLVTKQASAKTIVVTSAANAGPGTLRQALRDARSGDTITFDPVVFPPDAPTTIQLTTELPGISQGGLTIDASDSGVILDGRDVPGDWDGGLVIVSSHNVVWGLQVVNFSGPGIQISEGGSYNTIGGDRHLGKGPMGRGNMVGGNDFGICLWLTKTSHNTVEGNLVGINPDGTPFPNRASGVLIQEGANNNLVGPDNHIAFNGHWGIQIFNLDTTGNTIARNSIHDNGTGGIGLEDGGNVNQAAPILLDFDLATGHVEGLTLPNCEVLVYSDAENEGMTFEGKAIADNRGAFFLEKGSAFDGPVLTATTTDGQGNTSQFSIPTTGSKRYTRLQSGNRFPRLWLETGPSDELDDNRLGGFRHNLWRDQSNLRRVVDEMASIGLKHAKVIINEIEYVSIDPTEIHIDWSKPELSIAPEFDAFVNDLVSRGIEVCYILDFWDKANHPNGWGVKSRFKTEEEISRYLEFVRFIVTHFKGRVSEYSLWNEPDVGLAEGYPLQYIDPADYVNVAKRAIPVIREADPGAKILVGDVSGTAYPASRAYLRAIIQSDLMPLVDTVAWHPFYGDTPDSRTNPGYYANYPSWLKEIMSTARANGFKGQFSVGEINYLGPPGGGPNDPTFSDVVAGKYTARALVLHLGSDVSAGVADYSPPGSVKRRAIQCIANVFAGAGAAAFAVEVNTASKNFKVFSFASADGSKLVALWTDGAALEDDPGVSSTVTIPGRAGWKASGIDILNGLQHELITEDAGDDLVIRNLLVKDYPVIIKIQESASPSFPDVAVTHPYYTQISAVAGQGIVGGYDNGTFGPNNLVTRQQFAKMIVKALGLTVTGTEVCPFPDVATGTSSADPLYPDKYVAVCAANQITGGRTATTFAPYDNMTRAQLITMVARAANLPDPPAGYTPPFADFSPDHYSWARKAAYARLLEGLEGMGPGYAFLNSATRGEVCVLLYNLLNM